MQLKSVVTLGVVVTLLASLLSGCSFQLRGADNEKGAFANTNLQTIQLLAEPDTDGKIKSEMAKKLPSSIVLEPVQSLQPVTQDSPVMGHEIAVLLASTEKSEKRTSVSAIGETTAEFIRWAQRYEVRDASGKVLLTDEAFAYRDRQINPQNLLASDQEMVDMEKEMASEIAEQIIRRLQYLTAN